MMKKGAKVWSCIVILTVVGLMFSGLIDTTTSATTEKTNVSVTDSSPWFTKECYSENPWWWLRQYEETHDYYISTYVGGMSRLGGSPSKPNCWAKFKPYLSQSGKYEVYAYFYAWKYTSTKVPFTVKYAGGSRTIKVNQSRSSPAWKEKSLGTWYFKAGADTYVEVTDATGEPYDNIKGLTIGAIKFVKKETVPTPVVTGIDPSQPTASPAKQWITIKGTGFVSDSTVTLRIDSSTHPIPADRTEFKSSTQIRVRAGLTDPGTWTAQVTNPGNRISNLFSFTVKQDIPSPVHDMTVTDVYTSPSSPNVGQSTTIHVTVKNEGRQQENYVPVKAYVDGYQVGSAQYVTLLDGKSTTKSFTWTPSSAKTYSVKGEVGIVSGETDTSDNKKTISVRIEKIFTGPSTLEFANLNPEGELSTSLYKVIT